MLVPPEPCKEVPVHGSISDLNHYSYIVVSSENSDQLLFINIALETIQRNGTYTRLHHKYFGYGQLPDNYRK